MKVRKTWLSFLTPMISFMHHFCVNALLMTIPLNEPKLEQETLEWFRIVNFCHILSDNI